MNRFRERVFYLLLGSKLLIVATVLLFWFAKAYTSAQSWDIFHIILPLFATKITLIVNFWLDNQPADEQESFARPLRPLTYLLTIGYTLYFVGFITYYSGLSGTAESFGELKQWIGLAEILFGTYLGVIITKLYAK